MVSGKAVWLQERLGAGFREGCVILGKAVSGKRLGGFRRCRVVQESLGGFRRCRVVSEKIAWFPARLCGFTKVCVPYDVGSLMA